VLNVTWKISAGRCLEERGDLLPDGRGDRCPGLEGCASAETSFELADVTLREPAAAAITDCVW
jgi:hypothetical protein